MQTITTTRNGKKLYVMQFDGVTEHVEFARTCAAPRNRDRHAGLSSNDRASWLGVAGVAAARAAIRDGWQDGTRRMLDAMGKFSSDFAAVNIKRALIHGDHGDELDVHRALRGEIDRAWSRRHRATRTKSNVVTIACDLMVDCGKDADAIFWRGAAVARLADLLTEAGYAVELVAFMDTRGADEQGKVDVQETVLVKPADMPLDLNAVAASLCLAGYFRLVGLETITAIEERVNGFFGYPNYGAKCEHPAAHLIQASSKNIQTRETAEAWLASQIKFKARHAEAA